MKKIFVLALLFFVTKVNAQEGKSLLDDLEEAPVTEKVTGAFKSTRVINSHSVEMVAKGNLDVRILHRFGTIKSGLKDLFGLDFASMRMGFDYGLTNNFTIGVGRSTSLKDLDFFGKYRFVQQSKGKKSFPFTIVLASGFIITTQESNAPVKPTLTERSSYYFHPLIGRKFSSTFSAQFSPILVVNNYPLNPGDDNEIFGIGGGARYKISKRLALTADYQIVMGKLDPAIRNPLSLGLDIETGGHVFQLHFSNATGMNEKSYLTQTTGDFFRGGMRFGFNLSRMFFVGKKKKLATNPS
jgi:hypothetical protein